MSVDAEHAALFVQLVVPKIIHRLRLSRIRVAINLVVVRRPRIVHENDAERRQARNIYRQQAFLNRLPLAAVFHNGNSVL